MNVNDKVITHCQAGQWPFIPQGKSGGIIKFSPMRQFAVVKFDDNSIGERVVSVGTLTAATGQPADGENGEATSHE